MGVERKSYVSQKAAAYLPGTGTGTGMFSNDIQTSALWLCSPHSVGEGSQKAEFFQPQEIWEAMIHHIWEFTFRHCGWEIPQAQVRRFGLYISPASKMQWALHISEPRHGVSLDLFWGSLYPYILQLHNYNVAVKNRSRWQYSPFFLPVPQKLILNPAARMTLAKTSSCIKLLFWSKLSNASHY
jgi:hypothetical protein